MAVANQKGNLRLDKPHAAYEIEGIAMKISEKFRFIHTSFYQVDLVCITLNNLNLEKYNYDFRLEESVLQNIGMNTQKEMAA